ncbi:MAG: response regulator transcription factor [Actinomycetota bacterium]
MRLEPIRAGNHLARDQRRVLIPASDRHDRLARLDPYPDVQPADRVLTVELVDRFQDLQRCADRPLRIVLVSDGGAENGDHGVADELIHRALEVFDLPQEPGVERAQGVLYVFGIRVIGPGGEADEIAREHRDDLAFLVGSRPEGGAAREAEASVLRILLAAVGTGAHGSSLRGLRFRASGADGTKGMNERIRVLVVGDDGLFGGDMQRLLDDSAGVELVAVVSGLMEAEQRCRAAETPDVALLDLDLAGIDGGEATHTLQAAAPSIKVLVTARQQSAERIALVLASGACGFVSSSVDPGDLGAVLRCAAMGEMVMPVGELQEVLAHLDARRVSRSEARDGLDRLTVREREILGSLARGGSTVEVADELGISRLTVQSHVKSILAKLGVHSKVEAVTLAWRHGLAPVSRTA